MRYGDRGHHDECNCARCKEVFRKHNIEKNKTCRCGDCEVSRRIWQPRPQKEQQRMSTVNFCERLKCETMGKSQAMGVFTLQTAVDRETKRTELCPGCVGELVEWLTADPAGERPKAYREPWEPTQQPPADAVAQITAGLTTEQLGAALVGRMRDDVRRLEDD